MGRKENRPKDKYYWMFQNGGKALTNVRFLMEQSVPIS